MFFFIYNSRNNPEPVHPRTDTVQFPSLESAHCHLTSFCLAAETGPVEGSKAGFRVEGSK